MCAGGGNNGSDVCLTEAEMCKGACKNPEYPIPVPFYQSCATEEGCKRANLYVCNGECLPMNIPCNGTCAVDSYLWRTNRRKGR